jgi:hypothetical protein
LAAVVVVVLILWVYPGYLAEHSQCPTQVDYGTRAYCAELVTVDQRVPCADGRDCPASQTYAFQGVNFSFTLYNSSYAPELFGWVGEPTGANFSFRLLGSPTGPLSVNWTSTDLAVLVQWNAPFVTTNASGLVVATVICGVYLG